MEVLRSDVHTTWQILRVYRGCAVIREGLSVLVILHLLSAKYLWFDGSPVAREGVVIFALLFSALFQSY